MLAQWHAFCSSVDGFPTQHWSKAMAKKSPVDSTLEDLLYQALETEQGGIKVYETAIQCAVNDELREEWQEYLEETRHHEQVLLGVFEAFGLDPEAQPPSRAVVGGIGQALVAAMKKARATLAPNQAELVACEAVVLAETKDHSNWELLGHVVKLGSHEHLKVLRDAVSEVEEDEDHHLYHTKGWCRESWIQALGFPAVLPPPEEVKKVETAIGASRAEQARESML
jgi:rubrerythrin